MVKKALLLALMAFNGFTLNHVSAQVPSTFEAIVFDNFNESTVNNDAYTHARDSVYNDLWTFQNFNQAYVEINGVIVVDNGTPITDATFEYQLTDGAFFNLSYNDIDYSFTLDTTVFTGDTDNEVILPNTVYVSGPNVDYDNLQVTLYMPVEGAIAEPDAEGGLLELLVGYGVYNTAGLLMLFALTILVVNIALAFLQVPSIVYIIGNMVIAVGFMSFNFIPIWAGFIMVSVLVLFLILSIRGVRV